MASGEKACHHAWKDMYYQGSTGCWHLGPFPLDLYKDALHRFVRKNYSLCICAGSHTKEQKPGSLLSNMIEIHLFQFLDSKDKTLVGIDRNTYVGHEYIYSLSCRQDELDSYIPWISLGKLGGQMFKFSIRLNPHFALTK